MVDFSKIDQETKASTDFFEHFTEDDKPFRFQQPQTRIEIPNAYDPFKKITDHFDKLRMEKESRRQKSKMSVKDRAKLLGEKERLGPNPELAAKTKYFMSKLSEKSRDLLKSKNKFVLSSTFSTTVDENKERVFEDDLKNDRYNLFTLSKEGKYDSGIRYPLGYTASQINLENSEFEKIYKMKKQAKDFENKAKTKVHNTESGQEYLENKLKDMKEKLRKQRKKRVIEDWVPERLLCIRFEVMQPKKTVMRKVETKNVNFEQDIMPYLQNDLLKSSRPDDQLEEELSNKFDESSGIDIKSQGSKKMKRLPNSNEESSNGEKLQMPDENKVDFEPPSQDLFNSIFNDGEGEDSDSDDE